MKIQKENIDKKEGDGYDFFASAGLWKNRNISAEQLRDQSMEKKSLVLC